MGRRPQRRRAAGDQPGREGSKRRSGGVGLLDGTPGGAAASLADIMNVDQPVREQHRRAALRQHLLPTVWANHHRRLRRGPQPFQLLDGTDHDNRHPLRPAPETPGWHGEVVSSVPLATQRGCFRRSGDADRSRNRRALGIGEQASPERPKLCADCFTGRPPAIPQSPTAAKPPQSIRSIFAALTVSRQISRRASNFLVISSAPPSIVARPELRYHS